MKRYRSSDKPKHFWVGQVAYPITHVLSVPYHHRKSGMALSIVQNSSRRLPNGEFLVSVVAEKMDFNTQSHEFTVPTRLIMRV